MPSTEMVAGGTFDLTRAPQERWNEEMVKVVAKNVFRGHEITEPQLYYCLSVAEAIELNPMIGEIYFLPSKSRDAKGPAWTPYIGRNGLVNKAERAGCYYESDTVHEKDEFEITRQKNGVRTVRHSYSQKDRGEIVGAYAFLHDREGSARPAFFYAQLSEYLPTFDAEWKLAKSPWGNQTSAMIEKCFDAETEVLTDRGFELFSVAAGRVLQVTERGLEPTDARPFWQPYEGPMVTHASREVDFAVTPDHDLIMTGGRMEAREVYERARSRPVDGLAVRRLVAGRAEDLPGVSDVSLRLGGYYMADGHADSRAIITFNLARERKLAALRGLGIEFAERPGRRAGSPGNLVATLDATWLRCAAEHLPSFILEGKRIDVPAMLSLSRRQARVFVDAWREFDGDARNRLYCTDQQRLGAFEAGAVHAGYSVSPRRSRLNLALSCRPNYHVTLSERVASDLRRWGIGSERPGLRVAASDGRGVWCVTVPSGTIVVRRRGFSMVCGNCAMVGAGRKRLRLGNVLSDGEIEKVQQMASIGPGAPAPVEREFSWSALEEAGAARGLVARLRDAVEAIREVDGSAWPPAKVDLVATGMSDEELAGLVAQIEAETVILQATVSDSPAPEVEGDHSPVEGPGVPAGAGSDAEATVAVVDAVEVSDDEHREALRVRAARLEEKLASGAGDDREQSELNAELDAVNAELEALENHDQEGLWS